MTSYHCFRSDGEDIPKDVSELDIHPLVQNIPREACHGYKRLTSVNLNGSASLKTIGRRAFYDCQALRDIVIPPSVTAIEEEAFYGCRSLAKVRFHQDGGALTTIGKSAFAECRSLTDISIPSSVEIIQSNAFHFCRCLRRVSFQEGLKIIEKNGFNNCAKLEKVDIPRTLEMMGSCAFFHCTSLEELNIQEGNLRVIGHAAFLSCVKLQTINIHATIERVEAQAFKSCHSLGVIKFQNGLKHLGHGAFFFCMNLQAVALPRSVEMIRNGVFGECSQLVSVEWADMVGAVTIHHGAFSGCSSLVNICLPSECRAGANSFRGCTTLENQYGKLGVPSALMSRFDALPVHKKCYQASVTTTDDLAREIEISKQMLQDNTGNHLVDRFGMTPFHILLSAATYRIDLLQVLLNTYPPSILGSLKDVNGKSAVQYLTQQKYLTEEGRGIMQAALNAWLVEPVSSWKGLDVWKSDMTSRVNVIVAEREVKQRESLLEETSRVLSRYERIEATSLFELSLWKAKLKPANASADDATRSIVVDKDNRGACRIRSGASVVIPNVISFL